MFYALEVQNVNLCRGDLFVNITGTVDRIRMISNPQIDDITHITVAGPLSNKVLGKMLPVLEHYKDQTIVFNIVGLRKWLTDTNYSLVLELSVTDECKSILDHIWYKPDYPDGKPHITLFTGIEANVDALYEVLKEFGNSLVGSQIRSSRLSDCTLMREIVVPQFLKTMNWDDRIELVRHTIRGT